MNEFKITLTTRNFEIESNNLLRTEKRIFQEIIDNGYIEDLDIRPASKRRKSFGYYFMDFVSTNSFTIKENIDNYLNAGNTSDLDLNALLEEELSNVS